MQPFSRIASGVALWRDPWTRARPALGLLVLVLGILGVACGGGSGSRARSPDSQRSDVDLAAPPASTDGQPSLASPIGGGATGAVSSSGQIPIDASDATWGSSSAPVTIVEFSDFQCPFCSRAETTITQLRQTYGPNKLRVVFKHFPLPFHQDAVPAALAAQAVFRAGGARAFFAYSDLLFRGQSALTDTNLARWAGEVGVDRATLERQAGSAEVRAKLDADLALAKTLGVTGTPAFFINGTRLVGAQPFEEFKQLVDQELLAAQSLRKQGVADSAVYAARVAKNFAPEDAPAGSHPAAPRAPEPPDTTVWKVPVGKSPTRGPADALVTIVKFSDYQCPYCKKAHKTINELFQRYPGKIRLVYKHNPLAFHTRALPAALFATEARAQKGEKGFLRATELLFERAPSLEDADLLAIAQEMGLNVTRVELALEKERGKASILEDQDLADDLEARGTPAFFINGRRLSGAQPLEKFTALIDEELAKAQALAIEKKLKPAQVYAAIIKDGKTGKPFELSQVSAPRKGAPSRGAARAPVVIQVFSDFQCPFCQRATTTLEQIEKEFPGRVRIVWRNLPLPFHHQARLAAIAAMETHAQRGDAAFWKMHDLLFANQKSPGLERAALEGYAQQLGLDAKKFAAALDGATHEKAIAQDESDAKAAGITGTPAFSINGYLVSGAQPLSKFKKVIQRALNDAKTGRKAAP